MAMFFSRLFGFSGIRARRSSLQLQPAKWKRILLSLERLEDRIAPATLTVNSYADTESGTVATLDLREAILLVNSGGTAKDSSGNSLSAAKASQISGTFGVNDTIQFDPGLNGQTITLGGSALEISQNVAITELGASNLAVSGSGQSRVFTVDAGAQVSISGLTIEDGSSSSGGGIYNAGILTVSNSTLGGNSILSGNAAIDGGGVYNAGTLTVNNSTLSGNTADDGGGVYNAGTLTVSNSTLVNDKANDGGGIDNRDGSLTVVNSTLADDLAYNIDGVVIIGAAYSGGGIDNEKGTVEVINSTLANDLASGTGGGGGIDNNDGTVTVINSTLAVDSAYNGGGIYNADGKMTVINSTLADNSAVGGGGGGIVEVGGGIATLNNTIVANSSSGSDLYLHTGGGNAFAGAYDLIGDGSDLSNFTHSFGGTAKNPLNPLLAPLGNYGGPTQTFALLPGSPAIGAGSIALAIDVNGSLLATDQRGQPRIFDGAVDIGAYGSVGLEGASAGTIYSLSNGSLTNTSTNQVIASNVASFAQNSQGELCYLQNNGQLWFYGDYEPVASNVAQFAIDAAGAVIYLGQNSVLNALTVSQPLDAGTPIVLFRMDGAGSAVALDQNGNLIRFTPGSEMQTTLDHTITDSTGKVTSSVVTFAVDGTGSVVVLDSNGNLNRYAPGSITDQSLDTNVSKFAIDGAGSIVALETTANPASEQLADGQNYSTPVYNLVRFVADPTNGSLAKTTLDTGVTTMALDGDGAVAALYDLSQSSVTLANGQVYSTPSYTMVRFAPGKTTPETTDTGVTQMAVDGAGAIVFLDSLTTTPIVTLGNGQASNTPIYSLVEYTPGSTSAQVLEAPTQSSKSDPNPGVSRFAVDAEGDVVALDNLSLQNEPLSNGQTASYPLWSLVSFAASTGNREVIDPLLVSTFEVDGSGSVVALDDLSLDTSTNSPEYDLARLLPGATAGSYARRIMDQNQDVSQIVVDSSGAVFALESKYLQPETFLDGRSITIPLYHTLTRFAPGSDQGVTVDRYVASIAVDGSGSVVALDSSTQETLSSSSDTGQVYNEIVYNLVRFAPGSTATAPEYPPMDTGVSVFTVDASGAVVAMDSLSVATNGVVGQLNLFAPGSSTAQPMASDVSTFTRDGSGSVVALQSGALEYFNPGSNSPLPITISALFGAATRVINSTVSDFVIDGAGSLVALYGITYRTILKGGFETSPETENWLVRFTPGFTSVSQLSGDASNTASVVVDGSGAVFALIDGRNTLTNGTTASSTVYTLVRFAPGSPQGVPMVNGDLFSNYTVDSTGSLVALDADSQDLYRFEPGASSPLSPIGTGVQAFVVDGAGYIVALEPSGSANALLQYAPGSSKGVMIDDYVQSFALDDGSVIAVDKVWNLVLPVWEPNPLGAGSLVYFSPGSTTRQILDTNDVTEMAIDSSGSIVALEMGSILAPSGTLIRFSPGTYTKQVMDYSPLLYTNLDGNNYTVAYFTVDQYGYVVAMARQAYELNGQIIPSYSLVYYTPGSTQLQILAAAVTQIAILGDGTILEVNQANNLWEIPSGVPGSQTGQLVSGGVKSFSIAPGVQTYPQWQSYESSEIQQASSDIWQIILPVVETIGAGLVTILTAGAASPIIPILAGAGDAFLNQTINYFAFGTPFNLGSIGLGALDGLIGAAGGAINLASNIVGGALDVVSDTFGGAVADAIGDAGDVVSDISDTVGDLVNNVIDPNSFVGVALQKSFNSALNKFVTTGSLSQAESAAVSSLENSVAQGIINSSFVQSTETYLSNAAANLPGVQDGISLLDQIASDGLSGTPFGQAVGSLLANAAQNALTGKPIFQNAVSVVGQFVSSELGNTPFAQKAVALVNQAITNGVNANLANNILSFLGQTTADNLANSSFVQGGVAFVNQTLADGFGGLSLVQDGVSFLQSTIGNGLAGSNFATGVGSFLQQIGADGLGSLNSAITGEVGSFLQDAAQAGTDFANSTLGSDASTFLQRAAQNGADFLNSGFAGDATAFLQQAIPEIDSLSPTLQTELGSVLQDAAQAGTDFANSAFATDMGTFLQQAGTQGAAFLNSPFMNDAASFMQQVAQLSQNGLNVNSGFAVDGQALLNSVLSGNLGNLPFGQDVGAFLNQVVSNTGLATSSFASSAASFLQQAVAAGQTSSEFAQGTFTLLNGVDSAQLTNMVQSMGLAANNTISAQFQAGSSSDADAVVNFVNQLPSYNNSPLTVTLNLANGTSASGITANPPPGVTLIINGPSGTTTHVGHWNVTTSASNVSAVYNPNTQTVSLSAAVAVTGNASAQVNEGTVTFTVKNGQTIIGTPVQGAVSGGKASASFSLPAAQAHGNYTIAVSYSNSHGNIIDSGDTNSTLTVQTPPAITSGNSAAFTVGQGGNFTVTATGSPTPTLTELGALPSGVIFKDNGNGTATLSGAPVASGTYHFTITTQNSAGDFTQSFTLTVNPSPAPPPPAPPNVPSLLALFNQFLGGLETVNTNGTTITDNLFGFPLVETYDYFGNLVSVTLLGFNITFLFG